MNNHTRLSIKEKIGYGLGYTASNLCFQIYIIFLMFFYIDIFGIPAAVVSTLFIVSRSWDTENDPMMGMVTDRTNTKWGKLYPSLFMEKHFKLFL